MQTTARSLGKIVVGKVKIRTAAKNLNKIAILASLFFLFGFITCMNDILMPHLKGAFTLNWQGAALIQFSFFSAYFFTSIPASKFCEKVGYQKAMCGGLLVASLGAFGLMGSAFTVQYSLFLISLLVLASGVTLIQVAANPYVTLLGDPKTASSRLTIVQAFNALGTTVAPLIGSMFILSSTKIDSVQKPYFIVGIILVAAAFWIFRLKMPQVKKSQAKSEGWSELLQNKQLMLGAFAIFAYVGAEVSIGSYLIGWLVDPFVSTMTMQKAGNFVAFYWGGAMIGRFLGTPVLAKYAPTKVLQLFALCAITLLIVSMSAGGISSLWSILAVGLFNSIMFPTIFSLSIIGVRRGQEKASGLLCTSIVGGAIMPFVQGILADSFGLRISLIVPLVCYAYIVYFSYYYRNNAPKLS